MATLKGEVLRIAPENGKISETYAILVLIRFATATDLGRLYVGTTTVRSCVSTPAMRHSRIGARGRQRGTHRCGEEVNAARRLL